MDYNGPGLLDRYGYDVWKCFTLLTPSFPLHPHFQDCLSAKLANSLTFPLSVDIMYRARLKGFGQVW